MNKHDFSEIIQIFEKILPSYIWTKNFTPFETLIATILTQNTSDKNAIQAFKKLKMKFMLTPHVLAKTDEKKIMECIKPAGLHIIRSKRIINVSSFIEKNYDGEITNVLNYPLPEARKKLLDIPGVGKKTADIFLNFVGGMPVFPIDTHIDRISKRLDLVNSKAKYEEIRHCLEFLTPKEKLSKAHILMINFGRQYCRALSPLCSKCPINQKCKYYADSKSKV